ncbi:MAG: hypothetical protein EOO20_09285 [Chryseobacterium sp.]|nr:MAG: hypothetical protein EOO20_09285 [Chryseobacterium sp.]
MNNKRSSILQPVPNTLEIHYWLPEDLHNIDAFTQNICGHEILGIFKEIAKTFEVEIAIDIEPFGKGGFRQWLKVIVKDENKKAVISSAMIVAILTVLLTTPITKLIEKGIDKLFEDTEMIDLQKDQIRLGNEKTTLEIEELKYKRSQRIKTLSQSTVIRKKRSNFYETIDKQPRIKQVGFSLVDNQKITYKPDVVVVKQDFKNYVLVTDDLDPIVSDDITIEIIAPVLKKGHHKWWGIYQGDTIPFNMKSKEFKQLVQSGKVEFKNGSAINCLLNTRKKVDNNGAERVVGYDVLRVNHYFEQDKAIETAEGRRYRNKPKISTTQINLFGDDL